jgi:hypothetical protein
MTTLPDPLTCFDWRLATFEGSRCEQLRRWAALPLAEMIAAIEEMEELTRALGKSPRGGEGGGAVRG